MFGLNKYRVRDKKTERITRLIIVIVLLVIAFVGGAYFMHANNIIGGKTTSGTVVGSAGEQNGTYYSEEAYSGSSEVFQRQVQTYLADFFQVEDLDYVTEDMMNGIAAQITTNILNSLPANEVTQADWDKIEAFVSEATIVAVTEWNNEHPATTTGATSISSLTDEMKEYITSNISTSISMEYQIYMGEIDDLKDTLEGQSKEYQKDSNQYNTLIENIQNTLNQIENVGATDDDIATLQSYINLLSNTLNVYKSATSTNLTDLESEMISIKSALESAMEGLVKELKTVLVSRIEANETLSQEERDALAERINNLDAKTAEDLHDAVTDLQTELASTSEAQANALSEAIENWSDALEAAKKELSGQITAIMEGDEWIYDLTIPKADVKSDGSYVISNAAFSPTSDVSIDYETKTGFTIKNYVLTDGKLTIYFTEIPATDIAVSQIHIQNQTQDTTTP